MRNPCWVSTLLGLGFALHLQPPVAAAAEASKASKEGLGSFGGSPQDDQPCSCGGDGARGPPSALPQPPAAMSGVSNEGIYFIPEPLPAGETERDCTKQSALGGPCPPAEPQTWEHPSSYTASVLFTTDWSGPPEASEAARDPSEEVTRTKSSSPPPGQCPALPWGPPKSFPQQVERACLIALGEAQRDIDDSEALKKKRETPPVASGGPCRRGGAPTVAERRQQFLTEYGADYSLKAEIIAQKQLRRLKGDIYLDYAGSALYQEQQVLSVFKDLSLHAFGNAHSRNPSAKLTDERTQEARRLTLQFFGAKEEEFAVVFTSGTTAAIKLVGEDFPFSSESRFFYLRLNHNSVLGVREFGYAAGVKAIKALSEREVETILQDREAAGLTTDWSETAALPYCLFGFPLKDNFNGATYPLRWIEKIHRFGLSDGCRWYVLLDVAAAAPTTRIILSGDRPELSADFLATSFYKIFGYPTGLGALVLKRSAATVLKKVYWGGGSVSGSLCDARWQKPKKDVSARLEDGTVNFLSIAAIRYGFHALQAVGMEQIEKHVAALTRYLFRTLKALRHRTGAPFALLYWGRKEDPREDSAKNTSHVASHNLLLSCSWPPASKFSGGTVTFNLLKPDGSFVPFGEVEAKTAAAGIHIRTGCFCNPGGCQDYLGLTGAEIVESTRARESCSDPSGAVLKSRGPQLGGLGFGPPSRAKAVGAVRISMGYLTTFSDIDGLIDFLVHTFLWH